MASRIQGITVEIGGDTTKLTDACFIGLGVYMHTFPETGEFLNLGNIEIIDPR